jgi:hypothetical protein
MTISGLAPLLNLNILRALIEASALVSLVGWREMALVYGSTMIKSRGLNSGPNLGTGGRPGPRLGGSGVRSSKLSPRNDLIAALVHYPAWEGATEKDSTCVSGTESSIIGSPGCTTCLALLIRGRGLSSISTLKGPPNLSL